MPRCRTRWGLWVAVSRKITAAAEAQATRIHVWLISRMRVGWSPLLSEREIVDGREETIWIGGFSVRPPHSW